MIPWNHLALAVAILRDDVWPDEAFQLLETGRLTRYKGQTRQCRRLMDSDIRDMIRLKRTHTYADVGRIYGMSADAVCSRIRRFKQSISEGVG